MRVSRGFLMNIFYPCCGRRTSCQWKAWTVFLLLVVVPIYTLMLVMSAEQHQSMNFPLPPVPPEYLAVKQTNIPKIIHQIWHNRSIPNVYIDNIRNLTRHNPEWTYILWTWDDARKLLRKHFPDMIPLFEKCKVTEKSDVIRYAVLYIYGGAYFDMDTVSVKSLDSFLNNYQKRGIKDKEVDNVNYHDDIQRMVDGGQPSSSCLFSYEPPEHEFAYQRDPIVSTASILCQKQHALFLYTLQVLPKFQYYNCDSDFHCTGPGALTKIILHFTKEAKLVGKNTGIDVLESIYFQDKADITVASNALFRCLSFTLLAPNNEKLKFRRRYCGQVFRREHMKLSPRAVTYHTYDHITDKKIKYLVDISEILPSYKQY